MVEYPFTIRRLLDEEGGGYLAEALDLYGCMADGETIEETVQNLQDAIQAWIKTSEELGSPIPSPSDKVRYSGKWVIRAPKTLHRKLVELSTREGVSLNTLAVGLLSEGIGQKFSHRSS